LRFPVIPSYHEPYLTRIARLGVYCLRGAPIILRCRCLSVSMVYDFVVLCCEEGVPHPAGKPSRGMRIDRRLRNRARLCLNWLQQRLLLLCSSTSQRARLSTIGVCWGAPCGAACWTKAARSKRSGARSCCATFGVKSSASRAAQANARNRSRLPARREFRPSCAIINTPATIR